MSHCLLVPLTTTAICVHSFFGISISLLTNVLQNTCKWAITSKGISYIVFVLTFSYFYSIQLKIILRNNRNVWFIKLNHNSFLPSTILWAWGINTIQCMNRRQKFVFTEPLFKDNFHLNLITEDGYEIIVKIKGCLWNTTVCPRRQQSQKHIFSFKVKFKVTRSLTLVSFERASLVE